MHYKVIVLSTENLSPLSRGMVIVQHRIEGAANAERHPAFRCASAMEGDRIWLQLRGDIILEHLHTPSVIP